MRANKYEFRRRVTDLGRKADLGLLTRNDIRLLAAANEHERTFLINKALLLLKEPDPLARIEAKQIKRHHDHLLQEHRALKFALRLMPT